MVIKKLKAMINARLGPCGYYDITDGDHKEGETGFRTPLMLKTVKTEIIPMKCKPTLHLYDIVLEVSLVC